MNDERFNTVRKRWGQPNPNGNRWTGAFLLIIGALLLARTAGVLFPVWFFTWPVMLIGLGIFLGIRHNFRGAAWLILILIGSVFLADRVLDDINLRPYLWPIILMGAGLFILLKPKGGRHRHWGDNSGNEDVFTPQSFSRTEETGRTEKGFADHHDVIDITSIFAGIKKNVLSKNFKGGDVVAIMGGAEVNLTQADFTGTISIDNFNMFGGTKLIVPPDWDVQSQVVAIFGGVDDKRPPAAHHDPSKVIFLEGTCIFGGIEIRSF